MLSDGPMGRSTALILAGMFMFLGAANSRGEGANAIHGCKGYPIQIEGGTSKELALACKGGGLAFEFFRACGLDFNETLTVKIASRAGPDCLHESYGRFDASNHRIIINEMDLCSEMAVASRIAKKISKDAFFQSIVTHEVAHRIVEEHVSDVQLKFLVHEYAAYAAQYSQLPREAIRSSVKNPAALQNIRLKDLSLTMYGLSPEYFGIMAYSHFTDKAGGCQALNGLLTGKLRFHANGFE